MFLRNVSIHLQYFTAQKARVWTVTAVNVSNLLFHIENLKYFWFGVSVWSRKIICYFIKSVDLDLSVILLALRMWVSLGILVCSKWMSSLRVVKCFRQCMRAPECTLSHPTCYPLCLLFSPQHKLEQQKFIDLKSGMCHSSREKVNSIYWLAAGLGRREPKSHWTAPVGCS